MNFEVASKVTGNIKEYSQTEQCKNLKVNMKNPKNTFV